MGGALTYLADAAVTTTKTDFQSWKSENVKAAACSMQGWRRSMEDSHFMSQNAEQNVFLFGVFDGHGGSGVSRYCANRLPSLLFANENFKNRNFDIALHETFLDLDLETQEPAVQEQLFQLHLDSKSAIAEEDRKKVEIALAFETILDLFLGDPSDPVNNPSDPFKVFIEDYHMPSPYDIELPVKSLPEEHAEEPVKKRRKRNVVPPHTAEPRSPWGLFSSKIRQIIADEKSIDSPEAQLVIAEMQALVDGIEPGQSVPALMKLRPVIDWADAALLTNPLPVLFEGTLVPLFRPIDTVTWAYSIHPIDLLAVLNNNHMAEVEKADGSVEVRRCVSEDQGCTATVCLLVCGASPLLYCANAGDSRAILVRNGKALPLSIDHKPGLPGERRRVMHAGGKVLGKQDPRVQGDLNLSRAIGDWRHKQNHSLPLELQMISPRPDISITELAKGDEYIVLGCDGIWERFSSADCASFVAGRSKASAGQGVTSQQRRSIVKHLLPTVDGGATDPAGLAKEICEATVRRPGEFLGVPIGVTIGCDNMSVVVVELADSASYPEIESDAKDAATLPVISYGSQVPDDWTPELSGKSKRRKSAPPSAESSNI